MYDVWKKADNRCPASCKWLVEEVNGSGRLAPLVNKCNCSRGDYCPRDNDKAGD